MAVAAGSLSSCKDDFVPGGEPLPEGTEIQFGILPDSDGTRTYYDPTDESNANATSWKIYWNYQAPLDHVYVYSPQAAAGRNQAPYTVKATKDMKTPAPLTKDKDYGVQTGNGTDYNFYGFYPASAVRDNSGTGSTLSATMPINQTATTSETMTTTPVGNLTTTADMNCALMIAKSTATISDESNKVDLKFQPFASMIDITVNGTDENTENPVRVTSVIVEAYEAYKDEQHNTPAYIAGDFTYDYEATDETKKFEFHGENISNQVSIETMFNTADGQKRGVLMGNNSTMKVRAFLIPNPAVKVLKVKVVTSSSKTLTKTLSMTHFKASQIHKVVLPKINQTNLKLDASIWLSQLDPNIYISEITMPGSALSFNYLMSDANLKTQTLHLSEQFNAGARVFQCHVNNGEGNTVAIADSKGNSVLNDATNASWTLDDVFKALQKEMQGIHRDEFCVLCISDYFSGATTDKMKTLYSNLKTTLAKAAADGLVASGVTPETTINDVKGKVIVKLQLNGNYTGAWNSISGGDLWFNIYNSNAETKVFYSQMPFGTLPAGTAGGTSANVLAPNPGMNIIYSDNANPITNCNNFRGIVWASGVQDNATAVLAAYAENYESKEHRNFSMTYLGGTGMYYTGRFVTINARPPYVAQTLNKLWINNSDKPAQKPWGWVMCNLVGSEPTTTTIIQAILDHNADDNFKLERRPVTPTALNDGKANNGGALFKARRR